jgi:tetratricopeptide (TPR) repeat protein
MRARSVGRRAGAWAGFAAALLAASMSLAADKASPEARRAHALFDEGVALSDEGKWADALAAFQKSDEVVPSASARFNIGTTLRALGRYVEAKKILERVLEDDKSKKPPMKPALKKDITKLLDEVKQKVLVAKILVSPVDADVQMDGSPIARLPDGRIEVDPGKHVFVIKAAGHDTTTVTETLPVAGGQVMLTAPRTRVERVEVVKETPFYARAWFLGTVGAVVAGGAAVGIVFATRPKTAEPAPPPNGTVDRIIPAGFRF